MEHVGTDFVYIGPLSKINDSEFECDSLNEPIDVVYTWVNGSDSSFKEKLKSFNFTKTAEDSSNRFYGLEVTAVNFTGYIYIKICNN